MSIFFFDLETYSPLDIKKAGTYRYAENSDILLFAYAIDEGDVRVIDWGASCIPEINELMNMPNTIICAHNSMFDRNVLYHAGVACPAIDKWIDTRAIAQAHSLPGALGELSKIFGLGDEGKDEKGKALIKLFCSPRKDAAKADLFIDGCRNDKHSHPQQWQQFREYAKRDIIAMRRLYNVMPKWSWSGERQVWYMDQIINDRGFLVDSDLAAATEKAAKHFATVCDKRAARLLGISSARKTKTFCDAVSEKHGVHLENCQQENLENVIRATTDEGLKEVLSLRLRSAAAHGAKYRTVLDALTHNNRLKGTLNYCGALRTGRWSGMMFNPQNMPRPIGGPEEIEKQIEALKCGGAYYLYGEDVPQLVANVMRGILIAPKGKKLCVADLSSVESRGAAYIAGDHAKLEAFRDIDKNGSYDIYVRVYAQTFGVPVESVDKKQRSLGKVVELFGGYGGGVAAFVRFAKIYRVDLNALAESMLHQLPKNIVAQAENALEFRAGDSGELPPAVWVTCDAIKRLWREQNKAVVETWAELEDAFRKAITGEKAVSNGCAFDKEGSWVRIKLPSGRYLSYPQAKIKYGKIVYMGVDMFNNRKWGEISTWGGKLLENITSGFCRDILVHGMQLAEKGGYEIVLTVHDEIVAEADKRLTAAGLCECMSAVPEWASGMPLSAEGFETQRYRKD